MVEAIVTAIPIPVNTIYLNMEIPCGSIPNPIMQVKHAQSQRKTDALQGRSFFSNTVLGYDL